MRVIIDSGHSKLTGGKRAFDGSFYEYEFNYDVSNRIAKHLKRCGVDAIVIQVENANSSAELRERVKIANELNAELFVSIHANAFGTEWNEASGWEIYVSHKSARRYELARFIQEESKILGIKDRGIKEGDFYVLKNTKASAVLIEHGFFTNKGELELLKSNNFRELCAIADAKGILKCLGVPFVPLAEAQNEPQSDKIIHRVQVGAFAEKSNAERLKNELEAKGYNAIIVSSGGAKDGL